tara:strand:- start:5870 stop:6847 length:978 start_codon:yes stop_codon:yes gene_type:complete
MENWTEKFKAIPISHLAEIMGMKVAGKRIKPCPACGLLRTKKDRRGPVGFYNNTHGHRWTCYACAARGDGLDFVSYALFNVSASELGPKFTELQTWLEGEKIVYTPKTQAPREPKYPPQNEVYDIIKAAVPMPHCKDKEVLAFLKKRGLDASKTLAGVACPRFPYKSLTKIERGTGRKSPWWSAYYALNFPILVPAFNCQANLVSFQGRSVSPDVRKSSCPVGFDTANTFFLSQTARQFLQKTLTPATIWIVEGEMDFLVLAQHQGETVIGIRNSAVSHLQLMPWRPWQQVIIATDNDETGNRYAAKIQKLVRPAKTFRTNLGSI